jgi:cellulose synthase (UDP-forming)
MPTILPPKTTDPTLLAHPMEQGWSLRSRRATVIAVGVVVVGVAIATAWFLGEPRITGGLDRLHQIQQAAGVRAPESLTGPTLLIPAVALMLMMGIITRCAAVSRRWSRWLVVGMLLALMGHYLRWRLLTTLNLSDPLNGVFSLGLLGMELMGLLTSAIQWVLMLNTCDRTPQTDQVAEAVASGAFLPTVDVVIPTYDEPDFILRRTVIGCQQMDYPDKTVWLLDDTCRPEIHALAAELGCHYLSRPDNRHAKAGNLNHALAHTQGDLIAAFDADFVPTRNFLQRTVGFFQSPQVGLVQTPQSFYNPDPIARNLGLEAVLTPEEEVFYRQIQPMRDGAGSVVCSGTSFVVRRSALEQVGGFVTESISEDYFTAVRLAAEGNQVVYINEKLSAGLAAETIADHASQRLRWARGTLQAFFIPSNPLTVPGLTPMQRLGHLEGLLHWFSSLPQIGFLFMPLAYSFLGVIPIRASLGDLLFFFLPYYLVQFTVFAWLNLRSRSLLLSTVYSLVLVFPLGATVVQVLLRPFSSGFKVTPKGTTQDRYRFNWRLAWPLVIMLGLTAVSLGINLRQSAIASEDGVLNLGWIWAMYNLVMIAIALLILLDVPQPDRYPWFALRRTVQLKWGDRTFWGITTRISESGAEIAFTQNNQPQLLPDQPALVTVTIMEAELQLAAEISQIDPGGEWATAQLNWLSLSLPKQRQLIELLYCRPGQWPSRQTPGELASLGLLLRTLLRPRALTRRYRSPAVRVNQT